MSQLALDGTSSDDKPPPKFLIEYIASFAARWRYGPNPGKQQYRDAWKLAERFLRDVRALP